MAHELHELTRISKKKETKDGHGLHKGSLRLQTMTAFNQKFLQGAIRKAQSAGRKANNTINAMRQAPSSMRLPPGRRRQI